VGIRQRVVSRSSRIDALRQKYLPVLLHQVQQIDGVLQSQMTLERSQVSIDLQLDVQHFAIFEVLLDRLGHLLQAHYHLIDHLYLDHVMQELK
jgi:hypothetical protein